MEELNDPLSGKILDKETLSIIESRINKIMENPPNVLCVNVVLNNTAALKHMICREIIMNAANISEQEADWYILRSGAERELLRLAAVGVKKDLNDNL